MALLEVAGVSKIEEGEAVVNNISFAQAQGQKLAIAGATGSGKTSLLKMIAGLATVTSGAVFFAGERVKGPDERLLPGHPSIAYLSQYFELRNHYRVKDFLSMASKVSEAEAADIYRLCRIEPFLERWTHQLSGGEKQRIALARLLITAPKLLLLDEPFSNLDPFHKRVLKTVIEELSNASNITCMLVSHDPVDTLSWADEILILKKGELVQKASPQEVYVNPVDEYAAALLGRYNHFDEQTAKAFSAFAKAEVKSFVRPEKLCFVSAGKGVEATVKQVRFMGGYYEVEAMVQGQTVFVHTMGNPPARGETVFLAIC
ncbi:MAG TPA: ABC transporter ATP-binding protein [Flavisolibacter sp.]|nr:ABC transporter ATP-binding protein [Flavisolibacter sp.]